MVILKNRSKGQSDEMCIIRGKKRHVENHCNRSDKPEKYVKIYLNLTAGVGH